MNDGFVTYVEKMCCIYFKYVSFVKKMKPSHKIETDEKCLQTKTNCDSRATNVHT